MKSCVIVPLTLTALAVAAIAVISAQQSAQFVPVTDEVLQSPKPVYRYLRAATARPGRFYGRFR